MNPANSLLPFSSAASATRAASTEYGAKLITMVALSRSIGRKRALQMLLTGDPIDANTAREWGLVNLVVASERVRAEAMRLATRIADASPAIVAIGKRAFYAQIDRDTAGAYAYTKEVMIRNASEADACDGIDAFFEKRAPRWH